MNIIEFRDAKPVPDIVHTYNETFRRAAIVIDNGSYQCRAGWSNQNLPSMIFRNILAKLRKDRSKKDLAENPQVPQILIGNDITNIEAVRSQLKTQFDRNIVTQYETQEHIFDHIFSRLGINSENRVPHPMIMTEAFLNPNSCRHMMTELLFECYNIPSLTYGVDCLFAYHLANKKFDIDALIIDLGYQTTQIIPVINKIAIYENARRINIGGYHVLMYLQKILQLKYPSHSAAITLTRCEELLHYFCAVAVNYKDELMKWTNKEYVNDNLLKVQLPYSVPVAPTINVEQQKERKRELAKRLSEINARKREERLAEDEERLQQLLSIQDIVDIDDTEEIDKRLAENHVKNIDDLHKTIATLTMKIEKVKEKITASNNSEEIIVDEPPVKQKSRKMVFEDDESLQLYVQNAKKMRQEILNKKSTRKIRRQDMAKRRTAAGQERMRIISQLARKEKGNDDFGLRDEDWDIYKTISREGNDSDSDGENEKLIELDDIIKTYAPQEDETRTPGESYQLHIGLERYRAPELLFKPYMNGSYEAGISEVINYVMSLFSPEEQFRLSANVVLLGSLANLPGFRDRVLTEFVSSRPSGSYIKVEVLSADSLTAWQGIKHWARSTDLKRNLVHRKEYEECGYEYLRAHIASNPYEPSPKEPNIDVCD